MVPCPTAAVMSLQGPAYNRHTLPGDSEPTEQAKEILILRHKSLLVEVSGSDTCSSRKEVRGSTVPATTLLNTCPAVSAGKLNLSPLLQVSPAVVGAG